MSKQVGTCRFYVDIPSYLSTIGHFRQFGRNKDPSTPYIRQIVDTSPDSYLTSHGIGDQDIAPRTGFPINFMGFLNHNFAYETSDPYRLSNAGTPDDATDDIYAGKANAFSVYCKCLLPSDTGGTDIGAVAQFEEFSGFKEVFNMSEDHSFFQQGQSFACRPQFNGSSLFTFDELHRVWNSFGIYWNSGQDFSEEWLAYNDRTGLALGSFVVGKYYDVPFSPDLELTMSRRFTGGKKERSIGGKVFTNLLYDSPTEWTTYSWMNVNNPRPYIHNVGQFELEKPHLGWTKSNSYNDGSTIEEPFGMTYYEEGAKYGVGRKGLRSWDLTFSYISDSDMWMTYESTSYAPYGRGNVRDETAPTDDTDGAINNNENYFYYTSTPALSDNSFNFVWNTTLGGTIPFIFQPDNSNNATDQFSICVFREDSLDIEQIASNVYRLKVTIDEIA